ncbi:hypothetical protein PGB90_008065 [Kerria lacca]
MYRLKKKKKKKKRKKEILYSKENRNENVLTYFILFDDRNASHVCIKMYIFLLLNCVENIWRIQCSRILPPSVFCNDILSSVKSYKNKIRAFAHAWNPNDCSKHIFVKNDGFTLHRNPIAQSTDGIRAKIGFQHGRHVWEIRWDSPLGTVAVIGIATKEAPLQCNGYVPLIGSNDYSWGWNLAENNLIHKGDVCGNYPLLANAPKYEVEIYKKKVLLQIGEKIRVILDCEIGTLAFERNYEFLGVAFKDLPLDKKLYPCVSAVYGNSEIIMIYIGEPIDG